MLEGRFVFWWSEMSHPFVLSSFVFSEGSSIPVKMCEDLKLYLLLLIIFNMYYFCI